jgi:hypothetical protein
MFVQSKTDKGDWKYVPNDEAEEYTKEVVIVDEPEGQVVVKIKEPNVEKVLIDVPEGQVVLKKARKPKKKNMNVEA